MMMRKLFTALMCLILALTLPFAALAATAYEVSAVPGDDLASIEAAKDLLDVMSLRFLCGEKSGMFALALNGTDALNLALRADGDGVYAECAALGDSAFFFSKDDIIAQLSAMMKQSDMEGKTMSVMVQSVEQVFNAIGTTPGAEDATLDVEKQLAQVEELFAKDPAIAEFCVGILSNIKITDGDYTDPAHDPATQLFEVTITDEDMAKLADSTTIQKAIISDSSITAEEAKAKFTKMLETMDFSVPMKVYTSEESDKIVAFRIPMTIKGTMEVTDTEDGKTTTETKEVDLAAEMNYDRLTDGQVSNHHLTVSVQSKEELKALAESTLASNPTAGQYDLTAALSVEDDGALKEALSMKGALTVSAEGDKGWLGTLADSTQVTIGYDCVHTGEDSDKSLAIYTRADAVSILEPSTSDRPLLTLKVNVDRDVSEDALAAVNAATPENSTQVLQMTEEEMTAFLTDFQTKGMQLVMSIASQLPPSVMNLATGN